MLYATQLIFLREGEEETFLEFERHAIPLMEKHQGRMLYRIRPDEHTLISHEGEKPFEIHILTFPSEKELNRFMQDPERLAFLHLKDTSVKSSILIKEELAVI